MILLRKKILEMSTNSTTTIHIQPYAKRHFLKSFKKKYKTAREKTYTSIIQMIERVEKYLKTKLVEEIISYEETALLKVEFSIA